MRVFKALQGEVNGQRQLYNCQLTPDRVVLKFDPDQIIWESACLVFLNAKLPRFNWTLLN